MLGQPKRYRREPSARCVGLCPPCARLRVALHPVQNDERRKWSAPSRGVGTRLREGRRWPAGDTTSASRQQRPGWSERRASRSRRRPGTWESRTVPCATGSRWTSSAGRPYSRKEKTRQGRAYRPQCPHFTNSVRRRKRRATKRLAGPAIGRWVKERVIRALMARWKSSR